MMGDFWVFGYGSLMWRPGFVFEERVPGRLRGLHRALCVYSHVHRGTPERPGLVLGLDRGGTCRGVVFRIAASRRAQVLAYLREREQTTMVYRETERRVDLLDGSGRRIRALCYQVDRSHAQYAGVLPIERQVDLVRQGLGRSGVNAEYVLNTLAHLREIGIHDGRLEAVGQALAAETDSGRDVAVAGDG